MATIKDIAKACDVSIATVSNILNNKGNSSDATKKKVLKAAKEMKYIPNFMAKNLKQRETKLIGVIAEDLTVFNTPEIIDGIDEIAENAGYALLLGNLRVFRKHGNEYYHKENKTFYLEVENELRIMESKNVDGIIYIGAHRRNILPLQYKTNLPTVIAYGDTDDNNIPVVNFDDAKGAYDVTNILIEKGHKEIGIITGDIRSVHTVARLKGFQKSLFDKGILFNPENVANGNWFRESSYEAVGKLINNGVTGIFAMNDRMALGVYDYAKEHDLIIGKDIEVVGFDNLEISYILNPKLTTVDLPLHEIGNKAAEILIQMIQHPDSKTDKFYNIPCEIIKR